MPKIIKAIKTVAAKKNIQTEITYGYFETIFGYSKKNPIKKNIKKIKKDNITIYLSLILPNKLLS
jgi:REP element-mobilizing transposase RayT